MIFHEDCALNIEHVLFKGSDAIVIGWVKGDAGLSLVSANTTFSGQLIRSERPDVAEYFGIKNTECFGFALYSSDVKAASRASLSIRLLDKRSSTWTDILLPESADYSDGLNVVSSLKSKGLPEDFFQEGIFLDGVKFKLGGQADRRTAVGHIESVKTVKGGKDAIIVGWAVSRSPNNFVLKVGDDYLPYESFYNYSRKDIEEAFYKSFGQDTRLSGFIAFNPDGGVKNNPVQLYFMRKSTRTLQLVASTDQIDRDLSYDDILGHLKSIHTSELALLERVKKIDGPLYNQSVKGIEESAHYLKAEVRRVGLVKHSQVLNLGVVVPKGFSGDVLQCLMSLVSIRNPAFNVKIAFFYADTISDGGLLQDVADRASSLFGAEILIYNGCSNLTLGHLSFAMNSSSDMPCMVIDARSGFEYLKVTESDFSLDIPPEEIRLFYARDVNGVSVLGPTNSAFDYYAPSTIIEDEKPRHSYHRNRIFAMFMKGKSLASLSRQMGFYPLSDLNDLELIIRRSEQLSAKYSFRYSLNGLPFARTVRSGVSFQDLLTRQTEIYAMSQVGA